MYGVVTGGNMAVAGRPYLSAKTGASCQPNTASFSSPSRVSSLLSLPLSLSLSLPFHRSPVLLPLLFFATHLWVLVAHLCFDSGLRSVVGCGLLFFTRRPYAADNPIVFFSLPFHLVLCWFARRDLSPTLRPSCNLGPRLAACA